MRILCLTTCFPNAAEPDLGVFIERRMRAVARYVPVRVLAPVAIVEYGNGRRVFAPRGVIERRCDRGGLEVEHRWWVYPPLVGAVNGFCLALQMAPAVWRAGRGAGFDVIDAHFAQPEGVAAAVLAAIFGKPFVVTLRGSSDLDHAHRRVRRKVIGWALRRAARVITVSKELRQFAIGLGCRAERVREIPNGIDGSVFYPRERAAARAAWGVSEGVKLVLSVGHLLENKGHHRVAEAVAGLVEEGADVRLWIAGGAGRGHNFASEIKRRVTALGIGERVRFLGVLDAGQLAGLMSAADVLALASEAEGWPNVVHEAMACGTPVVATDVGAIPEMIPSPELGFRVPFGDTGALRDALRMALARDWDRGAIARYAQGRTWDKVAAEVVEVLEEVVAEHAGGEARCYPEIRR